MEIHIAKQTQRNFCAMENMTLQKHNVEYSLKYIVFFKNCKTTDNCEKATDYRAVHSA